MGNGAVAAKKQIEPSIVSSPFMGIEPPAGDIIAYLNDTFIEKANQIALIDAWTEEKITFGKLWEQAKNFSTNITQYNFSQGNCLAVCCPNSIEIVPVILGVWRMGGHVCFINHHDNPATIKRGLLLSNANIVLGHVDVLHKIADAWTGTNMQRVIMKHGEDYNNCIDVDELFKLPEEVELRTAREVVLSHKGPESIHKLSALLFTGGVSGQPKPVEITVRGLVYTAFCFSHSAFHRPSKHHILVETPSDIFGLGVLMGSMKAGSACILMKRYDMDLFFHTIVKYKIETLHMFPPTGLLFSQQNLEIKGNLSFIREVIYYCEGSPLAVLIEEQIRKKIKSNVHIRQVYGMSETTGPVCMVPSKHVKRPTEPGSSGYPLPGWELRIVNKNGDVVPVGQRGQVCVKGPYLMKGYRGEKKNYNYVATFDKNGWLHTGDYGYCTSEGEVHVLCRQDDIIKYQNHDVIPTELEALLISNPCVWDAGVIGFPDKSSNEVPMAWVVKNPDTVGSDVEIEIWISERIPDHMQIRGGVKLVNELPLSSSGQVLRKEIQREETTARILAKPGKKLLGKEPNKVLQIEENDKQPKITNAKGM